MRAQRLNPMKMRPRSWPNNHSRPRISARMKKLMRIAQRLKNTAKGAGVDGAGEDGAAARAAMTALSNASHPPLLSRRHRRLPG